MPRFTSIVVALACFTLTSRPARADQLTADLWTPYGPQYGHIDQNSDAGNVNANEACGPTSVTNSFTYLQNRFGITGLVAANPYDTIHELETDMDFDHNGVFDNKFVSGKEQYLHDHGLYFGANDPRNRVSVEWQADNVTPDNQFRQGGAQTTPTAQFLYDQLSKGQDVEVGFSWFNRRTQMYSGAGGHWVTATSINFDTVSQTGSVDFFDPWDGVHIDGNLRMLADGHLVIDYSGGGAGNGGVDGNDPDNPGLAASGMVDIVVAESPVPLPAAAPLGIVLLSSLAAWRRRPRRLRRMLPETT
jgi:hypothetical protein